MRHLRQEPKLTLVDLFAGCGGLSLGFENAGFEPVVVSELNESARRTYLVNRGRSDLFGRQSVDLSAAMHVSLPVLEEQLITLGDIHDLDDSFVRRLRREAEKLPRQGIDVVAGGPPCQGFSGIGFRRTHHVEKAAIPSNHLYREMIRVIRGIRPKAFVFENVRGLLFARWTSAGKKGEVWEDIRTAFSEALGHEYRIAWDVVQARSYGVPQNRPRVLMIGLRKEFASSLPRTGDRALDIGLLPAGPSDLVAPAPRDVLGDLCDPSWAPDGSYLRTERYPLGASSPYQREMRTLRGSEVVRHKGSPVEEHEYSRHSPRVVERFQALIDNDEKTLRRLKTKKFAQRALPVEWGPAGPTITVTSLPDDYVHFQQPRSLTVREWARLQGFPDWYEFKGPRTTGGERRAGNPSAGNWSREVPKYTQIGNAVPVKLAEAIGRHLRKLIG